LLRIAFVGDIGELWEWRVFSYALGSVCETFAVGKHDWVLSSANIG